MWRAWIVAAILVMALSGTAMAQRSIDGSYVELMCPGEICPNSTFTFYFYVWNASTDAEWLDLIEMTLPPGFTIIPGTDGFAPDGPATWAFGFEIDGRTARWYDNDGDWGEIYGEEGGTFWVDVQTGDLSGGTEVSWHLSGDDYGDEPHDVCGSFTIPVGGPSATEDESWSNLKAHYR